VIIGSGELIRSLLPQRLIDEYLLMIHPLVLGSGQCLCSITTTPMLSCGSSAALRPPRA
jgi:dihydrofolate reductase